MRCLMILVLGSGALTVVSTLNGDDGVSADFQESQVIKSLGGKVTRDQTAPGQPVIQVNLFETMATDADLHDLSRFTALQRLELGGTLVTGTGLKELAKLQSLRDLRLGASLLTDAGMR